jgi:hypothetical protein
MASKKKKPTKAKSTKSPKAPEAEVVVPVEADAEVVPEVQDPEVVPDVPVEADAAPDVGPEAPVVAEAPEAEPEAPPVPARPFVPAARDPRLPEPGSVITRNYKGTVIEVTVLADGFEFNGETYSSISKVAAAATGNKSASINGFAFFRLGVVPGGKGRSGAGTASRLAKKIHKIEGLVEKLRVAVQAGQAAMAEAEAEVAALKEKAQGLAE